MPVRGCRSIGPPARGRVPEGTDGAPGPSCSHLKLEEVMAWTTPVVTELCLGMEVTSYESAEIDIDI